MVSLILSSFYHTDVLAYCIFLMSWSSTCDQLNCPITTVWKWHNQCKIIPKWEIVYSWVVLWDVPTEDRDTAVLFNERSLIHTNTCEGSALWLCFLTMYRVMKVSRRCDNSDAALRRIKSKLLGNDEQHNIRCDMNYLTHPLLFVRKLCR